MDVIICVFKLLQLSVFPPQISNLLLQSLQESFSLTHHGPFLISDQPCHVRAVFLNGANQLRKDILTFLHCCLCRALLGHTLQSDPVGFSGTARSSALEEIPNCTAAQTFFSSQYSPYETQQHLSAPGCPFLARGFCAGNLPVYFSSISIEHKTYSKHEKCFIKFNITKSSWLLYSVGGYTVSKHNDQRLCGCKTLFYLLVRSFFSLVSQRVSSQLTENVFSILTNILGKFWTELCGL